MQGTLQGKRGISVVLDRSGYGRFEDKHGDTYNIMRNIRGHITIERYVYNEDKEDWEPELVQESWKTFATRHNITSLVS